MRKDIFIDNNIASKFSNPQDAEYIKLTKWLMDYDESDKENIESYAHLVLSKKLIMEYGRSCQHATSASSIPIIIAMLQRQGRYNMITNEEIKQFKNQYFSKAVIKKLKCNSPDRDHIPTVMLSDRKYALSYDKNFCNDIVNFPGFNATVAVRPEDLPYSE